MFWRCFFNVCRLWMLELYILAHVLHLGLAWNLDFCRSCDTVTLHYFFRTTGPGPGVQRDLDAPRYLGVPAPIPHDNPNLSVSDFVVVAPTWAFWMSSSPLSLASLASHWRSCCGPVPDHSRRPITS